MCFLGFVFRENGLLGPVFCLEGDLDSVERMRLESGKSLMVVGLLLVGVLFG